MRLAGRCRSGPGPVTAPEAAARTGQAGNAWALRDTRERDEWRAGHVPGAVHPPLTALAGGDGSVA
ncbi:MULTISPECIES: rhodanese-like domain-containing protein [unclassified Streptomyces]|uniref:rhodanese-like domain-containing protein n=1 Tax=unclassified Streptomyces TaxID=2593676 RepID=UPI0036F57202